MRDAATLSPDACSAGSPGEVLTVDIAAAKAVAAASPVNGTETVSLLEATGRVLAGDIYADIDLPPFDTSAMDGYAVRCKSLAGPGPWRLQVCGRIAAGQIPDDSYQGALRIFTGAMVPQAFDSVVMQEHCGREGDMVVLSERPRPHRNIRRAGEDIKRGDALLRHGALLSSQRLAVLAGQGIATVHVVRKIRIGLISTGSELREPGHPLSPGQIYNSNRFMLHAALAELPWVEVFDFGIVPDRRDALELVFAEARAGCDAIITTGGVSAGEEDHVTAALSAEGGVLDVLKVAMRPGKPVKVGRLGSAVFLGLPGNPNAALVTFRQIALPALRRLAGLSKTGNSRQAAVAGFAYQKPLGRTEFVLVRVVGCSEAGQPVLEMLGRGSSASLRSIAEAEGIALLPPDRAEIEKGASLTFEPF
ncbi:MAG: molybdopterin molybdenumtransferase MoeA [Kaistia sp. SCN 65-12]|nr:MAG: molybdopterin molybdenumtransferase MoeA [Kaistia sp. SCN 65-12]